PRRPAKGRRTAGRDGATGGERPRAEASGPARPPRIPPALLGPVLVGGVFLLLLLGMVAVVLFAG
ncbi:hypothetical protein, partial [Kitasatospora putterlickiae]|uniref:hypothetical protein n=1 Tax=Kitasatospora putterlickiae TaxID=221725 RepID=UPI0031D9CFE0